MRGDRQNYTRSPCRPVTHLFSHNGSSMAASLHKWLEILVFLGNQAENSVGFWEVFWVLGSVLEYGKCFAVWEVLDSGKCFGFWEVFWILGSVFGFWEVFWILGSVFGFWEVFLDSGKCFGFWEVFLDSGKCFWILGSVLDSGKCFGFWEVFCPYGPPNSSVYYQ